MTDPHRTVDIIEFASVAAAAVCIASGLVVIRLRGGILPYAGQLRDTDPATRAQVRDALRTGHSEIPGIDALARRVATRTVRAQASYRVIWIVIVLNAITAILGLFQDHVAWLTLSARASAVALLTAVATAGHAAARRSARYLRK